MSTALVSSTTLASATARIDTTRVGNSTTLNYVDGIDQSFGARPGDEALQYDERWSDLRGDQGRESRQERNRLVRFGGIFVSREVGTTIMQAQAQASVPKSATIPEAEKQIRVYEFNQSLSGTPQAITTVGVARF